MSLQPEESRGARAALALSALGVVFGDIGTSPLYALKECVNPERGFVQGREDLLGVLSLIVWTLFVVVTLKYLALVMRAHNRGEGGTFALLALLPERLRSRDGLHIAPIALLVLFGASLLCGEGVITPAISVLSAVEGLAVMTPALESAVVPLTCMILVGLFSIQRFGTGAVGRAFGPVMLLWFGTLAVLGIWHMSEHPAVLEALLPHHALRYLAGHGLDQWAVLGSIVLAVTGVEALYADMGHFGAGPIRLAWGSVVLPALVLAYFGQGALLLEHPEATSNPFFAQVPGGPWTGALVLLSAAATVIASQALISGAFSIVRQAVQLGYFPRVDVRHTSWSTEGQIYVPAVNWALAIGCLVLVLAFRESSRLASAYGVAVTGTMTITSIAFCVVARRRWSWGLGTVAALLAGMLLVDLPFLAANLIKLDDGGFVPVLSALALLATMVLWWKGHAVVADVDRGLPRLDEYLTSIEQRVATRVRGTGIFLTELEGVAPATLIHHVRRIGCLHERVVLLTIRTQDTPVLDGAARWELKVEGHGFQRLVARYGYMEQPDVGSLIRDLCAAGELRIDPHDVTYYLGRSTYLATDKGRMGPLSEAAYAFLERNAHAADLYFGIPPGQVVELGRRLDL
jgi:KUP system potassium uptake protein